MTRKQFTADLAAAANSTIAGVSNIRRGEEDGQINFRFTPASGSPLDISLLSTEVPGYPSENTFFVCTENENVPATVTNALEGLQEFSSGKTIAEMLSNVCSAVRTAFAGSSASNPMELDDDGDDDQMSVDSQDDDEYDGADDDDNNSVAWDEPLHMSDEEALAKTIQLRPETATQLRKKIAQDLTAVKLAGFRVGVLSGMTPESQTSLLSISIRIAKLGLSPEALEAWDLNEEQYIVLLLRYSGGYRDMNEICDKPATSAQVEYRFGVHDRYKPMLPEALAAFSASGPDTHEDVPGNEESESSSSFQGCFLSASMNTFLNKEFTSLVKIRVGEYFGSWDEAKDLWNDSQKFEFESRNVVTQDATLSDHIAQTTARDQMSFPLVSIQFALHFLVNCTTYCVVCHNRVHDKFEALRPFVCSKSLCLYQYINYGFGPSIEHEILTQPYVVDLLISLCYAAAQVANSLRGAYPVGLGLLVPRFPPSRFQVTPTGYVQPNMSNGVHTPQLATSPTPAAAPEVQYEVDIRFGDNDEVTIKSRIEDGAVNPGQWVLVKCSNQEVYHFKVQSVTLPTITLQQRIINPDRSRIVDPNPNYMAASSVGDPEQQTARGNAPVALSKKGTSGVMTVYSHDFDSLADHERQEIMVMLMDTLPSVNEMRNYLMSQGRYSEPQLQKWGDRISPAALGLLRWIICTNRSCIMQVDDCGGLDKDEKKRQRRLEQKVGGLEGQGWTQFRFAQGAPDKEQRFVKALQQEFPREGSDKTSPASPTYPTIFAWHGSGLANWHSIIRTGLDYNQVKNGRAYGNGVYHAQDLVTSTGYSHSTNWAWPASELKITTALCMNEIINAPDKFQSKAPHLVIQYVDWIQCRYLFVKTSRYDTTMDTPTVQTKSRGSSSTAAKSRSLIKQDPQYTLRISTRQEVLIPTSAAPTSMAFREAEQAEQDGKAGKTGKSRKSSNKKSKSSPELDVESEGSDSEDLACVLVSHEGDSKPNGAGEEAGSLVSRNGTAQNMNVTDFKPGSLNIAQLPMLAQPCYATPMATRSLQRALKEALEVQRKTPQTELGWYIDQDVVQNLYQWIVELHSFDRELPLAKDMKKAGINSVVLEIRFGKDSPNSPPFVRVIRPRFLPFANGGGGNVTAGGAMCMELLTNTGWLPSNSMEMVLLQVRMAISSTDPRPARLGNTANLQRQDYGISEAVDAYERACRAHGWAIPPDFRNFLMG